MSKSPKQLIVIGDSSVYGWGDVNEGGWCERLRKNWMHLADAPVIYPLGIRGDGLEKVAKRWQQEWTCRGELRRKFPDALLLSIGLNDTAKIGREDGRPQLSSEAFRFGLGRLLKDIKKQTRVMVLGLTPVKEEHMPFSQCLWYSNQACAIYERQIEESCLELDIPFLPTYKAMRNEPSWQNLIGPDGIHLNSDGHNWIYQKVSTWSSLVNWAEIDFNKNK
ncbi:GDSL-type esterase/lipase family protein [Prochlorococcus marinus]|uniref:Lysophospholipase L1 and related esterase n=1 Tax=Prochlorococcus marinus (strain MIT 9211) TaxID=93059 RepID=A9BA52_PROM4|nr:GDSL-type esterase/lipase family protein [Prochlorococcus marinus]ABX08714.1 Lysophospholipase L1 and related esterase [Prochlorococcus marinus str. MIT 9211]